MRRLLASDLLPQRAGQPVKALVHISFADLCELDTDSALANLKDYCWWHHHMVLHQLGWTLTAYATGPAT